MSDDAPGGVYGHGHHPGVVSNHARRSVADSAAYLAPKFEPGMTVLDLGCGPGSITIDIARLVAPGVVTGVDSASSAIEAAQNAAAEAGVDNVVFKVADAYQLPFDDNSFDAAHAHQVLQHLTHPVAALRELRRVVRPGGVVGARDADYETMVHAPSFAGIAAWRDLYCKVADKLGAEPRAGRMLLLWFHEAGLSEVVASSSTWTFSTPSERQFWRDAWVDRLLHARLNELSKEYGFATEAELRSMAKDWGDWAAHPSGFFTFVHGEAVAHVPA